MRRRLLALLALIGALTIAIPGTASAHFIAWRDFTSPSYPGAYPRTLCYKLVGDIAKDPLWVSWIDNAANLWNKANTGWKFKKCETDEENENPQIVFKFSDPKTKIDGGAQGSSKGGGPNTGNWEIVVQPTVTGMNINGTTVGTGPYGGWRMENNGDQLQLDPVLVMEHELGHALGLDHNPGQCYDPKTGNVEDPVCAGTHGGPNGRAPSQSDIDEVKKGLAAYNAAVEEAKKKTASGGGDGGVKRNQVDRISFTPGSDVAKDSVVIVNPGTQQRVAGGTISIIPENPDQPMTVTPLQNGTAALPNHGPGDAVIIAPRGHEPVTLTGKDLDRNSGTVVATPPKPIELLIFGGPKAPAITDTTVRLGLKGQYGIALAPNAPIFWQATDETFGDPPNLQHMTHVLVDPYIFDFRIKVGKGVESVEVTTEPPKADLPAGGQTAGGGIATGGGIGAMPPVLIDPRLLGGDLPVADTPTTLPGGLVAEGDQPCEIEGGRPAAPFATSKGSWKQNYPDQWWLGAIDWLKPDGSSALPDRGQPVIVAVIDTGVDLAHPDLANAAWVNPQPGSAPPGKGYGGDVNGWNFIAENPDVRDRNGHGTVVAGIIAANPNKSFGIAGINPWARIMALKAMEIDGKGGSIAVTRAIVYAVQHGAKVINLSVGGKHLSYAEQKALDFAALKGVVVVVASGNQGADTAGFSPAGLKHALTVAAIGPDLKRQTFSNWGANVALAAPGVDILSLRAKQTDLLLFARKDYKPGTGIVAVNYYRVTGSSFSAPMVSGAAALLLSARPQLTAADVTRVLEQSARDVEGIGKDQFIGYGLIDVDAALKADPKVYVEAGISGVAAVSQGGRTLVRVSGTASADRLQEAYIEIGQGGAPHSWKRVSRPIQSSVTDGVLDDLDPAVFAGAKEWTLRVIAVHQNGKRREARFKLNLG